ncbi:MAG: TIGR04282 family arsenosugar biosynthesis glycosyltransferase [Deltaproteobacteria bacterium]
MAVAVRRVSSRIRVIRLALETTLNMARQNVLIVFVKYPEPGKVKTRLARDIGREGATEIYRLMAERVVERVCASVNYATALFFDPSERQEDFRRWLGGDRTLIPQRGESLGGRMATAFNEVFTSGAQRAVIIGTDCLGVSEETVAQALRKLDVADIVIGPAEDGGYYLLGLKSALPAIFDGIEWSTERVFAQTIERVRDLGLSCALLDTKRDIDTIADIDDETLKELKKISI